MEENVNFKRSIVILLLLCNIAFGNIILDDEIFSAHNTWSFGTDSVRGKNLYFVNIYGTDFTGDGSGLTGIASGTGGVINTGSTTIGADSDSDDVGILVLQTRGTTRLTVANNGDIVVAGTITGGAWNGTAIDISSYTNLVAGTNITLSGDTLNVDDAFITNDASDTMAGVLTSDGVTITTGNALTLGTTQWDDGSDKIEGNILADDSVDDDALDFTSITLNDFIVDIASTQLTDTAALLYETELDTFSELQAQIADKTLLNEEDAATIDGAWTFADLTCDNTNMTGNISIWTNDAGYITTTLANEDVQDVVGGMVTGNTETLINVTYQDADGTLDLVVDEASIDHDALTNFAAGEHFLQSAITEVGTIATGVWNGTAIDISDYTNLAVTSPIVLTDDTLSLDEGAVDHGGLTGLGGDDHPQYIKDSEFTQDSGVLVGTGAGTFQEETGATLRTSLGLGTGDSPTLTNLTLSGLTATQIVATNGSKTLVSTDLIDWIGGSGNITVASDGEKPGAVGIVGSLLVPYVGADDDVNLAANDLIFSGATNAIGDLKWINTATSAEASFRFDTVGYLFFYTPDTVVFAPETPKALGDGTYPWSSSYITTLNSNTMRSISGDLTITAAGGDISFDDENLTTTKTITAEQLTSTDDITAAGTVQAEHLYSTDELVVDNDANIIGDVNIVGDITLGDVGGLGGELGSDAKLYPVSGGCVLQVESLNGLAANLENPPIRFTYYDHSGNGVYIPAIELGYGQHAAAVGLGMISRTLFVKDTGDTQDGLIIIPKAGTTALTDAFVLTFESLANKAKLSTTSGKARPIEIDGAGGVNITSSGGAAHTIGDGTNEVQISTTGDVSFAGSAGFYPRFLTQAAEPAAGTGATQCDTSEAVIWKDSDDNKVYLCFNDGGTVKTVELQ